MSGSSSYYNGSGSYFDGSASYLNGYESGSGIHNGNDDDDKDEHNSSLMGLLFALSPLIVGGTCFIIAVIIIPLVYELKTKYENIKYKCIRKYTIYIEEKKNPPPIKNNKLTDNFIKQCNKTNMNTDEKSLECSICLDKINIEDYKKKPNDLIFLNCSHVFHTDCIQSWTSSQVKVGRGVNCPLCRDHIVIDIPKIIYNNYDSDDSDSGDSVASYWND